MCSALLRKLRLPVNIWYVDLVVVAQIPSCILNWTSSANVFMAVSRPLWRSNQSPTRPHLHLHLISFWSRMHAAKLAQTSENRWHILRVLDLRWNMPLLRRSTAAAEFLMVCMMAVRSTPAGTRKSGHVSIENTRVSIIRGYVYIKRLCRRSPEIILPEFERALGASQELRHDILMSNLPKMRSLFLERPINRNTILHSGTFGLAKPYESTDTEVEATVMV